MSYSNYPPGVTGSESHFDTPGEYTDYRGVDCATCGAVYDDVVEVIAWPDFERVRSICRFCNSVIETEGYID